ncbi:MAG TPA: DNA repair protein RecN, partial [Armatimonadota bacterium]|nr:DNA repair protein RecN [Armatimonadota bacterium]
IEFNPERLEQVQERLELYRTLKRKYGDTVEEILAYRERIAQDVDRIEHSSERREELEAELSRLCRQTDEAARALYAAREALARRFEQEIAGHLGDLNMAGTRFAVQLQPPVAAAEGVERGLPAVMGRAEFLISANPGEPLRPLARIASGGEMSRVMLALKTAMAGSHPVALIFDEIDTGVGGKTAEALGGKMAERARSNQVLCVTHLPQIASMAGRHFQVQKDVVGERTVVEVRPLAGEARVGELARMLGGSEATAAQHARELLASGAG